jgi:lysophospholipase L1-like esterase
MNLPLPLPEHPLRCLHLGDSYTIAEGIPEESGWPHVLRRKLETRAIAFKETRLLAATGWTAGELLAALREESLDPGWDWITLCIGVNNQYRGGDPASFSLELEQLIQEARALLRQPPDGLLLLSIPDWSVSPFARDRDRAAIAAGIDSFNAAARVVAGRTGVPFIDWTGMTRRYANCPGSFAGDGLHPSAAQHADWAAFLEEALFDGDSFP